MGLQISTVSESDKHIYNRNGMNDYVSLGGSLFAQTGKEVLAPRINRLLDKLERQYKLKVLPKKTHVKNYWLQEYKRLSTVNSVIFGNAQRDLCQIYVPMSLHIEGDNVDVSINEYPKELIDIYQRIIIKDSLGMGKSTMMKRMFLDVIDREIGFPIYVELRNLTKEHTIIQEILNNLSSINKTYDEQLLLDLIEAGGFVFFLDGLDEIELCSRRYVVKNIQDFIAKSAKCQFVMTSREEESLAGFGDFKGCSIVVMNSGDVSSLLLRYGQNSEKVVELVGKISKGEYKGIDDFLRNPLLAGLLYRAYTDKNGLDLRLYQLCCNIFPVFFEQHDQTKDGAYTHEKKSKLDAYDMERLLMVIGFHCAVKGEKEFSYDDFNRLIHFASEQCSDLNVNIDNFRDDILKCVPIFCKDGCIFRWVHSSLCDYYAARYVYLEGKKNTAVILLNICKSSRVQSYENVLRMYAEMDINRFNLYVAKPFIDSYVARNLKKKGDVKHEVIDDGKNDDFLMDLIYSIIPSIFKEKCVLDINKAMTFSSDLESMTISDSINDLINSL